MPLVWGFLGAKLCRALGHRVSPNSQKGTNTSILPSVSQSHEWKSGRARDWIWISFHFPKVRGRARPGYPPSSTRGLPTGRAGVRRRWREVGGGPAHQLHAQAVLLAAVVAGDLLLDLLQRGRAPRLLCGLADVLEQTQRGGGGQCSRDSEGRTRALPKASGPEVRGSPTRRRRTADLELFFLLLRSPLQMPLHTV